MQNKLKLGLQSKCGQKLKSLTPFWSSLRSNSIVTVQRHFRARSHKNAYSDKTIHQWYQEFGNTGDLCMPKRSERTGSSQKTIDRERGTLQCIFMKPNKLDWTFV
ncbi:hypothetical protein ANN_11497 [Periplaneta americana]|uniref:DUF4817 domain-containing protein n=1 Tax=Periplaneta americana TaxID=6978 RepID=A0ABQ8T565_PERAM|nr:hypothetical protein ANN_11497 [Periplaneta americana]